MADATDNLMKLRPVVFTYKSDTTGRTQYGLVAEEVAELYPELVVHSADGQVETVRYRLLRAYPNNPAARKAMSAQAKWRKAM